jgi:hypothetical protein
LDDFGRVNFGRVNFGRGILSWGNLSWGNFGRLLQGRPTLIGMNQTGGLRP